MLWDHVSKIADLLSEDRIWFYGGAFHVCLDADGDWTLALRADSANRVRVDTCHLGRIRDTRWSSAGDERRLAEVAREAQADALSRA